MALDPGFREQTRGRRWDELVAGTKRRGVIIAAWLLLVVGELADMAPRRVGWADHRIMLSRSPWCTLCAGGVTSPSDGCSGSSASSSSPVVRRT
jgi:hypothetical protein